MTASAKVFDDFVRKQEQIYLQLEQGKSEIRRRGFTVHPQPGIAAYVIAYHYPYEITNLMNDISTKLTAATTVSIARYNDSAFHTTINGSIAQQNFIPQERDYITLCDVIEEVLPIITKPTITYDGWLITQDSVIARGRSEGFDFIKTAYDIQQASKKRGIELRLPWASHSTMVRFTSEIADPDEIRVLFEIVESTPTIGSCNPNRITLGYTNIPTNSDDLIFDVYREWTL